MTEPLSCNHQQKLIDTNKRLNKQLIQLQSVINNKKIHKQYVDLLVQHNESTVMLHAIQSYLINGNILSADQLYDILSTCIAKHRLVDHNQVISIQQKYAQLQQQHKQLKDKHNELINNNNPTITSPYSTTNQQSIIEYDTTIASLNTIIQSHEHTIAELRHTLRTHVTQYNELQHESKQLKQSSHELHEYNTQLNKQVKQLQHNIEQLHINNKQLNDTNQSQAVQIHTGTKQYRELSIRYKRSEQNIKQYKLDIYNIQQLYNALQSHASKSRLTKSNQQLRQQIRDTSNELQRLIQYIDSHNQDDTSQLIVSLNQSLAHYKHRYTVLQDEFHQSELTITELQSTVTTLQQQCNDTDSSKILLQQQIDALNDQLDTALLPFRQLQSDYEKLNHQHGELDRQYSKLTQSHIELQSQLQSLEHRYDASQQSYTTYKLNVQQSTIDQIKSLMKTFESREHDLMLEIQVLRRKLTTNNISVDQHDDTAQYEIGEDSAADIDDIDHI